MRLTALAKGNILNLKCYIIVERHVLQGPLGEDSNSRKFLVGIQYYSKYPQEKRAFSQFKLVLPREMNTSSKYSVTEKISSPNGRSQQAI